MARPPVERLDLLRAHAAAVEKIVDAMPDDLSPEDRARWEKMLADARARLLEASAADKARGSC